MYRNVIQAAKSYDVSKLLHFSKNIYKTIRDIINNKTINKQRTQVTINGNSVSDETIVTIEFNNKLASPLIPSHITHTKAESSAFDGSGPYKGGSGTKLSTSFQPKCLLMSINMIKKCFMQILNSLTDLANLSLQTGVFPSLLEVAKVNPIYKQR